ncbi:MAG TPA: VWA domain-containing protein [Candidatus Rifleibacterium sp.]|nr:VWA domain-containing protein [Candidatus Rifleibacterium sp.]HPT47009.1 VWA domain-containing protein [Candidatus Rifleibacterium sp.]
MRKVFVLILFFCLFQAWMPACAASLTAEKPVEFSFNNENDSAVIELAHPGDRLLAMAVEFNLNSASGGIVIEGAVTVESGQVTWNNSFNREVYAHDGPLSIVDNIKPIPGAWKLTIKPVESPVSGKISLIDLGPATRIEYSDKTGAIQICKPENNDIIALSNISHPDFPGVSDEFTGSVTANGDLLIPLPVGFYTLRSSGPLVSTIEAQMIPVHAGKITIIDNWPKTVQPDSDTDSEKVAAALASGSLLIERELKIRSIRLLADEQVSVRFATPNWQGVVRKEELEAREGGMNAEVISASSVATPLSLTILLDSSGSMKKDMKLALTSVEQFIKLLPEGTEITLIDFDTKARELPGKDRNALQKALKSVKADGATCLNDSVMLGLQKASGRSRPAILLFTDGFDANHNDTGPGSISKPEEMFAAVKTADVPVFTIGFGAKPDEATLKRLATLSGGCYNKANSENIARVFAQVASILGREHEMVYRRPGVRGNSDAPVISVVLDVSGSMNMPPNEEGCDYRLEKAKGILRDLFRNLPENAIAQLMTYHMYMNIPQVFTSDKIQLLASLAPVRAGGGTETLEALKIAFKTLSEIPSDRRYLLFITDAGLELNPAEVSPEYEAILGNIKDAGIQTTWIGMVDAGEQAPFDAAARLCNGKAVVSTDLAAVKAAVDSFGKTILAASGPADSKTPVQLTFSRREDNGRLLVMNAANKAELPPPPVVATASVNGLRVSFASLPPQLERYSLDLSQSLYGSSKTRDETVITQRLPLNITHSNTAMRLTVAEMLIMSKFRGLPVPCIALKVRLENVLPEQSVADIDGASAHPAAVVGNSGQVAKTVQMVPPYQIPDARQHFFAKFNQLSAVPVSDLSWLVEDPLVTPEDASLCITSGNAVEGYLVFEYGDSASLKTASLDFYDNVHGHIHLPLTGISELPGDNARLTKLPENVAGNLSDAFKLALTGFADQQMPEPMENYVLRVFALQVTSKVQAMLDINPAERLSLLLPTRFGDLVLKPSPRTRTLPMGWHRPVLFLPGSENFLKQAYVLPKSIAEKLKGTLRVDIAGGELLLAAGDKAVKAEKPITTVQGDKISLSVNACRFDNQTLYIDMTLLDEKDGAGTSVGISELCSVELGGQSFVAGDNGTEFMFQATDQVEVADGRSRRFLVVIGCPEIENINGAILRSGLFKLDLTLNSSMMGQFDEYMLTVADFKPDENDDENSVQTLAAAIHAERVARGWKKKASLGEPSVASLNPAGSPASGSQQLPEEGVVLTAPDFKAAVDKRLQGMLKMNEADFMAALKAIRCLPGEKPFIQAIYAPEAVLMQDWGTPTDLLEMARLYYKSTGAIVADGVKFATLTDQGRKELADLTGWPSELAQVPVLDVGARHLVVPFFKDASEITELVEPELAPEPSDALQTTAVISITLRCKAKDSGQNAMLGSMGDALGGGGADDSLSEIPLFESALLDYHACSKSPIDIFYFSPDYGKTLCVSAEGANGTLENMHQPVSLADYEVVEEVIQIKLAEQVLEFVRPLTKGVSIVDTFRTVALCMPDMTASSAMAMAEDFSARKTGEAPGTKSTARWFSRAKIFKFLAMHSAAEAEAVLKTGVKAGRPGQQLRAIILTLNGEPGRLRAIFDLRQINPVVHGDEQAVKAFNFYMGIANTLIEEQVMGGGSLFSRWRAGEKQQLLVAGPDEIGSLIEGLAVENLAESTISLLQQAAANGQGVIFPTMAPVMEGKPRPAWFVFDPTTGAMNSVLDNGAHGSMVEKPITEIINDAAKYSVGFLIGTNVSLWSVVTYSIVYDDLKKVVKAAKALSLAIAEQIKDVGKPLEALLPELPDSYSAHEGKVEVGPVSVTVGFGNLSLDGFKLMTKPSIGFNFSYQSGFEDAVKLYFKGN